MEDTRTFKERLNRINRYVPTTLLGMRGVMVACQIASDVVSQVRGSDVFYEQRPLDTVGKRVRLVAGDAFMTLVLTGVTQTLIDRQRAGEYTHEDITTMPQKDLEEMLKSGAIAMVLGLVSLKRRRNPFGRYRYTRLQMVTATASTVTSVYYTVAAGRELLRRKAIAH